MNPTRREFLQILSTIAAAPVLSALPSLPAPPFIHRGSVPVINPLWRIVHHNAQPIGIVTNVLQDSRVEVLLNNVAGRYLIETDQPGLSIGYRET